MLKKSLVPCVAVAALALLVSVQQANAQGRRGGGGMGGMRGPQGINDISVAANTNEAVKKELNIKPDQAEKLKDLAQDVREESMQAMQSSGIDFQALRDASPEERAKIGAKIAEVSKTVNEKFAPKLAEILDKTQLKRVHEIAIQAAGAHALLDAGVQKELNLTQEEKDKLASISKDFQKQIGEVARGQGGPEKMRELSEEQLAKSTEVLTKDQQSQFASMKGKPFDVKLLRPAGRRGGGFRRGGPAAPPKTE
jgi:Spy/CpxP family protein refolding chaperone